MRQVLQLMLGFVKLSRVSNATIDVSVAGMFRQESENVCGKTQVLLMRTKLIKRNKQRNGICLFSNRCKEGYRVFYSDCLVDAELDVNKDVFVRYERET